MRNNYDLRARLIVASNRLPVTAVNQDGRLILQDSVGGVATGIRSLIVTYQRRSKAFDYVWVGWPGTNSGSQIGANLLFETLSQAHLYPVLLSGDAISQYYSGFSNSTLWPLFHYFSTYVEYDETYWRSYQEVNQIFCDALLEVIRPGDLVWIHDYHLMLLPKLLRARASEVRIGFTLHIPFPPLELFQLLPKQWARSILEGILGADIAMFNTQEYAQCFSRSVTGLLGYRNLQDQVEIGDRLVDIRAFPIGIDFELFWNASSGTLAKSTAARWRRQIRTEKVVLSIDRLDYTKGIANRLEGYERFLEQHSEWHRRVVVYAVVTPSRLGTNQYRLTKSTIEQLIGRINGRFGTADWVPIHYQHRIMTFQEIVALYKGSDVCAVTSLRDGMCLIAKEYVASRTDSTGVLILSEFAGAANEMSEALLINPNDRQGIADAIHQALEMPSGEQIRRNQRLQNKLRQYDVSAWGEDSLRGILDARPRKSTQT